MTENRKDQMLVSKIENGTVIDKIPAGKSLEILKILKIKDSENETIAIGIHVSSKSMGRKDLVKLTNRTLSDDELKRIWLISPEAKISKIVNFDVNDQFLLSEREFSNEFEGVLKCINPTCATNFREPVKPRFLLMKRDPLLVRCLYCDRVMVEENVRDQL